MRNNSKILNPKNFWRVMLSVAALNGALAVFGYIVLHGVIGWHLSADSMGAILVFFESLLIYLVILAVNAMILHRLYGMKLMSLLSKGKRLVGDAHIEMLAGLCVAFITGILILVGAMSIPSLAEALSPTNGIDHLPLLFTLLLPTPLLTVPAIRRAERALAGKSLKKVEDADA